MLYKILDRELELDNMIEPDDIFDGRTLNKINRDKEQTKRNIDVIDWVYNFKKSIPKNTIAV